MSVDKIVINKLDSVVMTADKKVAKPQRLFTRHLNLLNTEFKVTHDELLPGHDGALSGQSLPTGSHCPRVLVVLSVNTIRNSNTGVNGSPAYSSL